MNPQVIDRLKSQLLTSRIQTTNQPLYQVINQLIDALKSTADVAQQGLVSGGGGGGGGTIIVPERIYQIQGTDGYDGEDGLVGPPGPVHIGAGSSGHMYNDNNDTTVSIPGADTLVEIPSGFSAGQLDGFTFNGSNRLICQVAGKYLLVYSVSLQLQSVTNKTFEAMFMLNGTGHPESSNHAEISIAGIQRPCVISGSMTYNLVVGDQIGIGVSNHDDGTDVVVVHANASIFAAAGPMGPQGPAGTGSGSGGSTVLIEYNNAIDGLDGFSIPSYRPVVFSGPAIASSFQNTLTDFASQTIQIAVGDVIYFEAFGKLTNSSGGSRTYELAIVIGGKTVLSQAVTGIANNGIVAVFLFGWVTIVSASESQWVVVGRLTPVSTDNVAVTDIVRSTWSSDTTNNYTGLQTVKIQVRQTTAGASSTLTGGFLIEKRPLSRG